MMPLAWPPTTTRSSISEWVNILTAPRPIMRESAE